MKKRATKGVGSSNASGGIAMSIPRISDPRTHHRGYNFIVRLWNDGHLIPKTSLTRHQVSVPRGLLFHRIIPIIPQLESDLSAKILVPFAEVTPHFNLPRTQRRVSPLHIIMSSFVHHSRHTRRTIYLARL